MFQGRGSEIFWILTQNVPFFPCSLLRGGIGHADFGSGGHCGSAREEQKASKHGRQYALWRRWARFPPRAVAGGRGVYL